MLRFMLTAGLLSLAVTFASAKTVDNPEFAMWKDFGKGSSVTHKMVTDAAGQKMETVETTVIVSVSATEVVVSTERTMMIGGQEIKTPAAERTIPAQVEVPDMPPAQPGEATNGAKVEQSTDTLQVAGHELACDKITTSITLSGNSTVSEIWNCKQVPGHAVKMVSKTSGTSSATIERTLTAFTVK